MAETTYSRVVYLRYRDKILARQHLYYQKHAAERRQYQRNYKKLFAERKNAAQVSYPCSRNGDGERASFCVFAGSVTNQLLSVAIRFSFSV